MDYFEKILDHVSGNRKKKRKLKLPQLIPVPPKEKSILLGVGHQLSDMRDVGYLSLPDGYRKGHFFCFGTTRIGKTRLMEAMIEQDIRLGHSVCVIDPKGDVDLFSKIVQVAYEENRQDELMLLSPIFPDCSIKIDPLSHFFMPEEIVNHCICGIKAKEEFFINIAYEVSLVVVNTLICFAKVMNKEPELNFQKIKDRIDYQNLKLMRQQLSTLHTPEAAGLVADLDQILTSPQDYFAKVSSSLRTTLTALTSGNVGQIVGKVDSNRFIDRLENGKRVIIVVQTGALLTRKTAHIIARVFVSMIQSYIGRVFASNRVVDPPLCIYMDEAANVMYQGVEELFSKAGGAGVWVHAFTQSISDLVTELQTEDYAYRILDNTNTKLFMRVNNPETAQYISDYAGLKQRYSPILGLGGSIAVRETEEERLKPEKMINLKNREFILFTYADNSPFEGKTVTVPPAKIDVKYPEVMTTGKIDLDLPEIEGRIKGQEVVPA